MTAMNCKLFINTEECSRYYEEKQMFEETFQGICPKHWHIPSDAEWETLANYTKYSANYLKSSSNWQNDGNGQDNYGFHALPAGMYSASKEHWLEIGSSTCFWTTLQDAVALSAQESHSTVQINNNAYIWCISNNKDITKDISPKLNAYSIRCVKDE